MPLALYGTVIFTILGAIEMISILTSKGKITATLGIVEHIYKAKSVPILDIKSCYAIVKYEVDAQIYISKQRVVVPCHVAPGDEIKVYFFNQNPNKLYISEKDRCIGFFLFALFCLMASWVYLSK